MLIEKFENGLLTLLLLTGIATAQDFPRNAPIIDVPVADGDGGYVLGTGDPRRDADHGTVAMNSDRDIIVAFHSERRYEHPNYSDWDDDIPNPNGGLYAGNMKQVEIAYYDFDEDSPTDRWIHLETRVIGSIEIDPLGLPQDLVKCERPDVIAVEDRFFVVWTRRYSSHSGFSGQQNEPAVLECAWIEKEDGPSPLVRVFGDDKATPIQGLGYILDAHLPSQGSVFHVRECAGVPDAVPLVESDPYQLEVAVVYPHFVEINSIPTVQRKFDLRVVTCSFDKTTKARSKKTGFDPLWASLEFNGPKAPLGIESPGLILPDVAPSPEEMAFWVVHERQRMKPDSGGLGLVADGRIKLEYYKLSSTNKWEQEAAKTFRGSNGDWAWRRRPTISSYTADTSEIVVAIAFGTIESNATSTDASGNAVYEHWEMENGSLISPPTYPGHPTTSYEPFPIDPLIWYDRPFPLNGRTSIPLVRRCFVTGQNYPGGGPTNLAYFDPMVASGMFHIVDSDAGSGYSGIRRPAAAYLHYPSASIPDYFAVTWEKQDANNVKRVYILAE